MGIRRYALSWASSACLCGTLALLFGDGLAALYNDRRGQPEMQQAMDNAPLPPARNLPFPSGQGSGYPILLTQKTSTLLSEALHMLQRIKDVRERKWVEAFIHRLGSLAADLEESSSRQLPKEAQDTLRQPFDAKMSSIPSLHAWPPVATNKFNKAQAKYQVTSAQVNDVLPINDEGHLNRQVVTKPSLLSTKADDDLVLQLHNQDSSSRSRMRPKSSPLDGRVTYPTRPLDTTTTQAVTPTSIPVSSGNKQLRKIIQAEKDVLKHQQEAEKDVRGSLNSHHVADFTSPDFAFDQKHNFLEDDDEFEIEEDEGAAVGEPEDDEEPQQNTVSPSLQKLMEAGKAAARLFPDPVGQQYRPVKQFVPPEPTMSAEMERQLRAGKIVVLSDSLVKTNFQSKENNDGNAKEDFVTQPISPSHSPLTNTAERHVSNRLPQNYFGEDK